MAGGHHNPVRDASGRVTKVIKLATDISANLLHEQEEDAVINAIKRSMAVIEFTLPARSQPPTRTSSR